MGGLEGLCIENREAWTIYNSLCGRTVRNRQLEGWLLDRLTAEWDHADIFALFDRLDVIGSVLEPDGDTQDRRSR